MSIYQTLTKVALTVLMGASVLMTVQAATTDKPPFFKASFKGQSVYLLGSVHVGKADFYPLPSLIEQAFDSSKGLVVEVDPTKADVMALVKQYGYQSPPLPADIVLAKQQFCLQHKQPCQAIAAFAPWLQATQIAMSRYADLGYSSTYGLDQYFMTQAQHKTIYQLESMQQQFKLLAEFPLAVQFAMLKESMVAEDELMLQLVDAWRGGDHQALFKAMLGDTSDPQQLIINDKILFERNITMAQGIKQLMTTQSSPLFVVIGAGHLVGERSVVDYLEQQRVKVQDCWHSDCKIN